MKKLQWNKIPAHVLKRSTSSVWKKVGQVDGVEPDYFMEEDLFKQAEKKKVEKTEKPKEPKEVKLLDISSNLRCSNVLQVRSVFLTSSNFIWLIHLIFCLLDFAIGSKA